MVWQHYAVVLVVPSSTQRWLAFLLRRRTMLESMSAAVLLSFTSSFSLLLASFRRVRLRHVSSSDSFKMPLACKHGEGKAGEWMLSKHLTTASSQWTAFTNYYYIASSIGAGKVRMLNAHRLLLLASFPCRPSQAPVFDRFQYAKWRRKASLHDLCQLDRR